MESLQNPIVDWLSHYMPSGLAAVLFAVLAFLIVLDWRTLGTPANRQFPELIDKLLRRHLGEHYRTLLEWLLAGFSVLFGATRVAKVGSQFERWFGCQPFTAQAYERSLLLAIAYPILFLLIGWALNGEGRIGEVSLLDGDAAWLQRIGLLLSLVVAVCLVVVGRKVEGWKRTLLILSAAAILLSTAGAGGEAFGVANGVVVIGAGIFVVASARTAAVAGGFAASALFAGNAAVAVSSPGKIVSFVAFVLMIVAAYKIAIAADRIEARCRTDGGLVKYWPSFSLFTLLYLLGSTAMAVHWADAEKLPGALVFLLFLGLLPLANAPLDWLSVGITRGLLTAIKTHRHRGWVAFGWALLDVVIATFFLLAVAGSTFGIIAAMNWAVSLAGASPVLDLHAIGAQLMHGEWRDGLWIWLMLLSTLVPTLLHFLVALLAAVQSGLNPLIEKAVAELDKDWTIQQANLNSNNPHPVHSGARLTATVALWTPKLLAWSAVLALGIGLIAVAPDAAGELLQWLQEITAPVA